MAHKKRDTVDYMEMSVQLEAMHQYMDTRKTVTISELREVMAVASMAYRYTKRLDDMINGK